MSVIHFQGRDNWFSAKWGMDRLFQDIRKRFQLVPEDDYELDESFAMGGMDFGLMQPQMRERMLHMLKATVEDLVNDNEFKYIGTISQKDYQIYRDSLPNLLVLLNKYEHAEWHEE